MFYIWTLLPALYVIWRFIKGLKLPKIIKVFLSLAVIAGCEFHLISYILFGTMFSPELPTPLMFFLGWFFGCIILFSFLLLVLDLLRLLIRVTIRHKIERFSTLKFILLIASALLSGIGVKNATQAPNIRTVDIIIPGLATEFDGFTLVQLTDLHTSRLLTGHWLSKVVDKTNTLRPDLIVVTGDMADGTVNNRKTDVEPFARLTAPEGIFAITGNHEYYFNADEWIDRYTRLGMHFLNNSHVRIQRGNASLVLAGVTDKVAAQYDGIAPSVKQALQGTESTDTIILLDHNPLNAPLAAESGVSLQLSGHTHGGMIRGFDMAVALGNNGFVSGLYHVGEMILYVSNGTGLWNGFPLRLGVPSEITYIRLRSVAR